MLKFILLFGIAQQVGGNSTLTRDMSTQIVTQELLNVTTGTKFAANFLRYPAALTKRFSCFSDYERKARLPKPLTTDQRVIVIAGTYLLLLVLCNFSVGRVAFFGTPAKILHGELQFLRLTHWQKAVTD